MSIFAEALDFLREESFRTPGGLEDPILQVIVPDQVSIEEQALIEKVLASLPFKVSGFLRVKNPTQSFCIDFTGKLESSRILAAVDIKLLIGSPELKKKLWALLSSV